MWVDKNIYGHKRWDAMKYFNNSYNIFIDDDLYYPADFVEQLIKLCNKHDNKVVACYYARAILKDAPIYIFDDSFSALDFLTEAKVRTALNEKLAGKTRIVITQRVVSAMHSDRIFVLADGRLVGVGTHAELLENCSIYREIFLSQTGGGAA